MRRTVATVAIIGFALVTGAWSAHATILDGSDAMFGWTTDTSTGLDWLDFDGGTAPTTIERPYDDVAAELGSGGDYDGWRFASRAEVYRFFLDVTGYPFLVPGNATANAGATDLVAAWTGYSRQTATLNVVLWLHGRLGSRWRLLCRSERLLPREQ
jgi:hypothetical protein